MKRLMERSDVVIAAWALILCVLWIPSWAIWHPDSETTILFAIAIAATLAKAASATVKARRDPEPGDRGAVAVVGTTHATSLAGVALVAAVLGLELGLGLLLIAAGLMLVALGGLWRERRAARQAIERLGSGRRP